MGGRRQDLSLPWPPWPPICSLSHPPSPRPVLAESPAPIPVRLSSTLRLLWACPARSGRHRFLPPLISVHSPRALSLVPPSSPSSHVCRGTCWMLGKVRRLAKVILLGWAQQAVEGYRRTAMHQVRWGYFIPANRSCWFAIWRIWPRSPQPG